MEKYLSIRCIKLQTLHSPVLLYKDLATGLFNILCEEFTHIERGLSYVKLEDVSFVIYQDRRKLMDQTGVRTVHAVAKGSLITALPTETQVPKKILRLLDTLPEIDYNPFDKDHFYFVKNKQEVKHAKELYAYDGKVKVLE